MVRPFNFPCKINATVSGISSSLISVYNSNKLSGFQSVASFTQSGSRKAPGRSKASADTRESCHTTCARLAAVRCEIAKVAVCEHVAPGTRRQRTVYINRKRVVLHPIRKWGMTRSDSPIPSDEEYVAFCLQALAHVV